MSPVKKGGGYLGIRNTKSRFHFSGSTLLDYSPGTCTAELVSGSFSIKVKHKKDLDKDVKKSKVKYRYTQDGHYTTHVKAQYELHNDKHKVKDKDIKIVYRTITIVNVAPTKSVESYINPLDSKITPAQLDQGWVVKDWKA